MSEAGTPVLDSLWVERQFCTIIASEQRRSTGGWSEIVHVGGGRVMRKEEEVRCRPQRRGSHATVDPETQFPVRIDSTEWDMNFEPPVFQLHSLWSFVDQVATGDPDLLTRPIRHPAFQSASTTKCCTKLHLLVVYSIRYSSHFLQSK